MSDGKEDESDGFCQAYSMKGPNLWPGPFFKLESVLCISPQTAHQP